MSKKRAPSRRPPPLSYLDQLAVKDMVARSTAAFRESLTPTATDQQP